MTYYSCVTVLTVMALGVLCTLVRENDRMSSEKRVLFYVAYAFIAISVIAEWCGVMLDGQGGISEWPLRLAKWADHTFTPLAGGALIWQLRLHNKWEKAFNAILLGNVIIQTAALPFDWIVRVDQMGHYLHGDLYGVYIVAYLAAIVIAAVQLMLYGRSFRRQNHLSLYAIMLLTLVGIGMQEVFGGEVHVAYLSLTLSAAFLFIHNGEYFQLARDEDLVEQRKKIMTDELTGMHSRHAYSLALKELAEEGVPDDLAVFSIDVNGLKEANDTHGHDAGDELLRAAARRIVEVFSYTGACYRTGGDEFVVLASMGRERADKMLEAFAQSLQKGGESTPENPHLAVGYALAADYPELSPEQLVAQSDKAMYKAKMAYYRQVSRDRRKRYGGT